MKNKLSVSQINSDLQPEFIKKKRHQTQSLAALIIKYIPIFSCPIFSINHQKHPNHQNCHPY